MPLPWVCQNTPSRPRSGICPLDDIDWPPDDVGWRRRFGDLQQLREGFRMGTRFERQLNDAMRQAPLRRELSLQLLLARHGSHRPVDPQNLMVSRDDLAGGARLAIVEQDEVLHDVQQPVVGEHAVQQYLGVQAPPVCLVEPLPLREVLPFAGDRPVAGAVPVRNDQEGVVMEGMGDDVLVQVVGEVVVEALADVPIDRLQLDEDQRQPVDETDQIGAAVVVGGADPGQLELAHGEEAVRAQGIVEVDHPGAGGLPASPGVSVLHGYAGAEQPVEVAVVLHHRAADVVGRQRPYGVVDGRGGKLRVQSCQRRPQVAGQHRFLGIGTTEGAAPPEGLLVPGVDAIPAQHLSEMLGEGRLHQPIFAVDGRHRHGVRPAQVAPDPPIRQRSRRS